MMMKMRENMHIVLYALVIVFVLTIFLSWGAGGTETFSTANLAGKIGSRSISSQEFQSIVNNQMEYYKSQGQEIGEAQKDLFRRQVWDQMVNEYILKTELENRGITFSGEEFKYAVYNDPLPGIKNNPQFQENSVFSPSKFRQYLQNPNAAQMAYQLQSIYRSSFPQKIMQNFVENTNIVSEAEVLESYKQKNLKAKLKFFGIRTRDLNNSDFEVSDADIKKYYDENREEYKSKEKRKVEFVRIDVKASKEDSAIVLEEMKELKDRLSFDSNFAEEAKISSEDLNSKDDGGLVDWFAKGNRSPDLDEAMFSVDTGVIVGPFWDEDKYVLAKVIETRRNKESKEKEIKIRQIVKYIIPGPTTKDNFDAIALEARTEAADGKLKAFAENNSIFYNETAYFTDNGFIPGIGRNGQLSEFIFKKSVGSVSYEIRQNSGNIIYIVKILDMKEEGYQDLEEVKSRIKNIVLNNKKEAKALELLNGLKSKLNNSTFEEVKGTEEGKLAVVDTTSKVNYYGRFIPNVGMSAELSNTIENLTVGSVSNPVKTSMGVYVVEVVNRDEYQQDNFEKMRPAIRTELENQAKFRQFQSWLLAVKENYDIEEYRLY